MIQYCICIYIYRMTCYLGSGQFGTVNQGVWNSPATGPVNVAIKTLNNDTLNE